MATYSQGYVSQIVTTDAEFRARGLWISDQLTALGWAKTADTGQIDWATVTKPTVANTVAGYEIRQSNDAFADIYVKIEYGSAANVGVIGFWWTFGAGSDGAGAITGVKTVRKQTAGTATGAVGCTDYVCGNASRFWVLLAANTSAGTMTNTLAGGGVQRTTDASGVDTATGFFAFHVMGPNACTTEYVGFSAGSGGVRSGFGSMLLGAAPRPGSASAIPVYPIYMYTPTAFQIARDFVAIPNAYASLASTHTFSLMGSNRTYIALWGNSTGSNTFCEQATTLTEAYSLCLRWE